MEDHAQDWAWLYGDWRVQHRRLRERLASSTQWDEFAGTCTCWPTMSGLGNCDDNWLDLPAGAYRAMAARAFDTETQTWGIWWIDGRFPAAPIDPPVRGTFENGVGTFISDGTHNERPILVRYRWTDIHTPHPHWEQAFSPDNGASWEVNWRMEFSRA